ncbi:MAG: (2Fe-2S)-binding protein [Methylohalobius sp. ZOD2]
MYVCVCKAVTDGQIRDAIGKGVCTRKQLTQCLGVGKDCGRCNRHIREIFSETLQRVTQPSVGPETLCRQNL